MSIFHWFSFACNPSLNFFGTDCTQVLNSPSCPNMRNTHGSEVNIERVPILKVRSTEKSLRNGVELLICTGQNGFSAAVRTRRIARADAGKIDDPPGIPCFRAPMWRFLGRKRHIGRPEKRHPESATWHKAPCNTKRRVAQSAM